MQPVVSIIIPCFNNEEFIDSAIQSALDQTYDYIEVIVIDDGSVDGSLSCIRYYDHRIKWETGPNRGAPVARNRGLKLAQGEFVKFLDADDILLPDCLERQVTQALALAKNKRAVAYGDALWVDRQGELLPGYPHRPRYVNENPVAHILANSPLTSCPLHRRNYLLDIGGFDPSIPKGQEHDLHLRLLLAGIDFVYHPGPVYKYREHNTSGRISNHPYSRKGPLSHYETLQKQHKLIEQKTQKPLAPQVSSVLAQRFWAYGRAILREGFYLEADCYFKAAKSLHTRHCVAGGKVYKTLVNLCGPYYAETLLAAAKVIRR